MQRLCSCILLIALGGSLLILAGCSSRSTVPGATSRELSLAALLAQLEALPTPAEISQADFDALRASLREQLRASGKTRWSSTAPLDEANKVGDFYLTRIDDNNASAHWTYRNIGDYDQNSEVNISDLTGLGANLGKNSAAADWAAARVADGDGNNEVNIADITPLGSHLLNRVTSYSIQMSTSPAEEASWQEVGSLDFALGTLPSAGGPLAFSLDVPAQAGQSFRVRPRDGSEPGIASDPYAYDGSGGPPPMDPQQRQAIMDAIKDKFDNGLTTETSEEQDEELAAFIGAQPGIIESGYVDGLIWGIFSDGLPVCVFKNRDPDMAAPAGKLPQALAPAVGLAPPRQPSGIPQGNTAVLFNSFTANEPHYSPIPALRDMLEAGSYFTADFVGSVENYGDFVALATQCDVLYVDAHGSGFSRSTGEQFFVITTVDLATPEYYAANLADFLDKSLVPGLIETNTGSEYRVCISDRFIDKHSWGMTSDSLVFLNVCHGAGAVKSFLAALANGGAQHLISWDMDVGESRAFYGAIAFFAATLGDNRYLELGSDPYQRPFSPDFVIPQMNAKGSSGVKITPKYPVRLAKLRQYEGNFFTGADNGDGTDALLMPSIEYISVDEHPTEDPNLLADDQWDILTIAGSFDPDGGTVYVNNVAIPDAQELEWSEWLIRIAIPNNQPFGGDVVVEQGAGAGGLHRSNPVALTEWTATFHYSEQYSHDDWSGSLTKGALLEVHFRGCIQKYRSFPWGTVDWHSETFPGQMNGLMHICVDSKSYSGGDWVGSMSRTYIDESSNEQTIVWTRTTEQTEYDYSLDKFRGTQYVMGGDCTIDLNNGLITLDPWVRLPYTDIFDDTKEGHSEIPEAGVLVASAAQAGFDGIYSSNGGEEFAVAGSSIGDHEQTVTNGKEHWYRVWWWDNFQVTHKPAPDAPR